MARIRSVHPGLFTDEAFVSVSMAARVLLPGIWTECDDHGVFEWKPLTLKMKIFPADNVNVEELLAELTAADVVKKFSVDGKEYGAVRNFAKYQRPKKPAYRHPLPEELRTYVALKGASSEPVENQSPTSTEKSPQMEDGGGNRREGGSRRGKRKKKEARAPRGAPLPEGWTPTDEDFSYVEKLGLTRPQALDGLEEMRLWAGANSNRPIGRKASWSLTYRGWMRRNLKRGTNGKAEPNRFRAALDKLGEHVREIDRGEEGGEAPVRLLSSG